MVILTDERWYSEIGDAIRAKTGAMTSYSPPQMANAIRLIDNGSGRLADCIAMGELSVTLAMGLSAEYVVSSAFISNSNIVAAGYPRVSLIMQSAFAYCANLSWISFPNCQTIEKVAFIDCDGLSHINLPECLSVGSMAFYNCANLRRVELPKCDYVGQSAFQRCGSLERVEIPVVTVLGPSAFHSCSSLTSISLPECVKVDHYGLRDTGLMSITLPKCSVLGIHAVAKCSSLSYVRMDVIASIGDSAFTACTNLTSVDLTNVTSVPTLGSRVFNNTPMYVGGPGRICVHSVMYERFMQSVAWAALSANIVSVS